MSEKKAAGPLAGMASTMSDGMEMMRRMWGMAGLPQMPTTAGITQFAQGLPQALPSMITPTLDVGELDKRIADLRAVEQWLNLNASMLRATIQTLEVQRNTIATIRSFGGTVLATMNQSARPQAPSPSTRAAPPAQPPATVAPGGWPLDQQRAPAPEPARKTPRKRNREKAAPKATGSQPAQLPVNATAWWGALQDQFARVAAAAAAPASRAGNGSDRPAPRKSARKRKIEST